MTNRDRLQLLLDGGTPDVPPHWELVFQIPQAMFGMDPAPVHSAAYASDAARDEAFCDFHLDVAERLIEECDWAAIPPHNAYSAESIIATRKRVGEHALVPGYEGGGVFWMPSGTDMLDFAVRLFEQPDDLRAEARRKCDAAKEQLKRQAGAGVDFFVLTYDFGYNDAPFVAPRHFEWLVVPYLTEIVQTAHDLGRKAILHSDGCLTRIIDQIYSTGLDGYQSVDPQGGMDIAQVRAQYPDWLLMGNVPCNLLQDVDDGAIRAAVRQCMTHGGVGKRYILSTSNCIFHGMPPESYRIMLDEYRAICRRSATATAPDAPGTTGV